MKKLLSILGALGISITLPLTVIACSTESKNENETPKEELIPIEIWGDTEYKTTRRASPISIQFQNYEIIKDNLKIKNSNESIAFAELTNESQYLMISNFKRIGETTITVFGDKLQSLEIKVIVTNDFFTFNQELPTEMKFYETFTTGITNYHKYDSNWKIGVTDPYYLEVKLNNSNLIIKAQNITTDTTAKFWLETTINKTETIYQEYEIKIIGRQDLQYKTIHFANVSLWNIKENEITEIEYDSDFELTNDDFKVTGSSNQEYLTLSKTWTMTFKYNDALIEYIIQPLYFQLQMGDLNRFLLSYNSEGVQTLLGNFTRLESYLTTTVVKEYNFYHGRWKWWGTSSANTTNFIGKIQDTQTKEIWE